MIYILNVIALLRLNSINKRISQFYTIVSYLLSAFFHFSGGIKFTDLNAEEGKSADYTPFISPVIPSYTSAKLPTFNSTGSSLQLFIEISLIFLQFLVILKII